MTSAPNPFLSLGSARPAQRPLELETASLPHAQLSYSMEGEDLMLRHTFKRRMSGPPGIYVDIGCSRPFSNSDTYLFYALGWSGVAIDLHAYHAPEWAQWRPRDKFIHTAVSDSAGETYVYGYADDARRREDLISSSPTPPHAEMKLLNKINTRRLDDILNESLPHSTSVQFFNIDVEGSELGVLRSNDWQKWRPEVILIEIHGFDLSDPRKNAAAAFLMDVGYTLDSKMHASIFFRDGRSAE